MRTLAAFLMAVGILSLASAFAQQPQAGPTLSPSVQNLMNQMHAVGCQAEEQAAATTIDGLQKKVDSLQAQLNKLDPPPKSGATKH